MTDVGDTRAGSIKVEKRAQNKNENSKYELRINRNHSPAVQFSTLVHELAHLYLNHIGPNASLNISLRPRISHDARELESESVSYLICSRNKVQSKAHTYLANYVTQSTTISDIDIYRVMRSAGQIEALLGLSSPTKFKN